MLVGKGFMNTTYYYYDDGSGKAPRYYQLQAINKTIEAITEDRTKHFLQ